MKNFRSSPHSKCTLGLILVFSSFQAWAASPLGVYQHGTVVRMEMADCLPSHHGFMASFGPPAVQAGSEACPEYVLVSDKVVFVIVGKSSGQLVPLADVLDFRLSNNEIAVRLDDAKHESKFSIREMVLRSQWDVAQKHLGDELNSTLRPASNAMALRNSD